MALDLLLQGESELGDCAWGSRRHVWPYRPRARANRAPQGGRGRHAPTPPRPGCSRTSTRHRCNRSRVRTHLNASDAEGNVASLSMSNGSRLGVLPSRHRHPLQQHDGRDDDLHPGGFDAAVPGERVASMMSPTLLLDGDQVLGALGTGGQQPHSHGGGSRWSRRSSTWGSLRKRLRTSRACISTAHSCMSSRVFQRKRWPRWRRSGMSSDGLNRASTSEASMSWLRDRDESAPTAAARVTGS